MINGDYIKVNKFIILIKRIQYLVLVAIFKNNKKKKLKKN